MWIIFRKAVLAFHKEKTMSGTNGTHPSTLSNLAWTIIPCCGMLE